MSMQILQNRRKSLALRAVGLLAAGSLVAALAVGCGGQKNQSNEAAPAPEAQATATAADMQIDLSPASIDSGKTVYMSTCAPCHGTDGKGDGPAAAALNPKPRDHTDGAYMDTLTNNHIYQVVHKGGAEFGMPGMPAQPQLSEAQLHHVVAFVRSLSTTYMAKHGTTAAAK